MADPKVVEQEFVVRVPQREENKKYHVMKFRASPNHDFSKWTGSRMVRENRRSSSPTCPRTTIPSLAPAPSSVRT